MPDVYDVCIIGGGPSGHSASLYTSRSMLKTILFEGTDNPGGQLTKTTEIENYLGDSVDHKDLEARMQVLVRRGLL